MESGIRQWFLPRYFGQRKIKKAIRPYALQPVKPETVQPLLHQVIRYQEELDFTDRYTAKLPSLFGRFGRDEEWPIIRSDHPWGIFASFPVTELFKRCGENIPNQTELSVTTDRRYPDIQRYPFSFSEWIVSAGRHAYGNRATAFHHSGITVETLYTNSADWIGIALQQAGIWKENLDKLKDWYQWLQSYKQTERVGSRIYRRRI